MQTDHIPHCYTLLLIISQNVIQLQSIAVYDQATRVYHVYSKTKNAILNVRVDLGRGPTPCFIIRDPYFAPPERPFHFHSKINAALLGEVTLFALLRTHTLTFQKLYLLIFAAFPSR